MPIATPDQVFEFDAEIKAGDRGGAYIEAPFSVADVFGTRGQVRVLATIDGEPYRGSLANMGTGCHVLGVLKAIRSKIGKQPGDMVHITLHRDTEERTVDVPYDLQQALAAYPNLSDLFQKLSYTHRKEYVNWITEAKRAETRGKRILKTLDMLREGMRGK